MAKKRAPAFPPPADASAGKAGYGKGKKGAKPDPKAKGAKPKKGVNPFVKKK